MRKTWFVLMAVFAAAVIFSGCASVGTARLPDRAKLFVSTSPEDGFILAGTLDYPYQPLGYVAVDSIQFTPTAPCYGLKTAYGSLEKVLNTELKEKAKKEMGADGVIGLDYLVSPGVLTYVRVRGLAIKRK